MEQGLAVPGEGSRMAEPLMWVPYRNRYGTHMSVAVAGDGRTSPRRPDPAHGRCRADREDSVAPDVEHENHRFTDHQVAKLDQRDRLRVLPQPRHQPTLVAFGLFNFVILVISLGEHIDHNIATL